MDDFDLQSIAKRFWAKVDKRGDNECWPWKAAMTNGLGIFVLSTKPKTIRALAHRIAIQLGGTPLGPDAIVKRTCRMKTCCNPKHLYVKGFPIALTEESGYNDPQRGKSSLGFEANLARRFLLPLRSGKSVVMVMDDPKWGRDSKYRGKKQRKLVVIAPGPMHGFAGTSFLISIVGGGSRIVTLNSPNNVANLVLAGMPAALAKELMNQIHQVMKE